MFPIDILKHIKSYIPIDSQEYKQFKDKVIGATIQGKRLKFTHFTLNLRYDSDGIYSYTTKIAELNLEDKTIKKLGWWSKTTSRHYNWTKKYLQKQYDFKELFKIQ